jgi:Origin of replication binding protein/Bifunctional DNA primase/polymerase, N-terminal
MSESEQNQYTTDTSIVTQKYTFSVLQHVDDIFKNPEIRKTARFLIENGYPVIPVAPQQSADKFPKSYRNELGQWVPKKNKSGELEPRFTGKNPSFLDIKNYPTSVKHANFQNRLPSESELRTWFANIKNGIGTLGGWNQTTWIDFDVKNFNNDIDARFQDFLDNHPTLKGTWIEKTHSGGYRVVVKCSKKPSFTNFSLDCVGGTHHGEALGNGRYTVLAPTLGVSGNHYRVLNLALPIEVESLESIGIFPSSSEKSEKQTKKKAKTQADFKDSNENQDFTENQDFENKISILELTKTKIEKILETTDRSKALAKLFRELYGWRNWIAKNLNLGIEENILNLIKVSGNKIGVDSDRVERIIKNINPHTCYPGVHYQSGAFGCWEKIKRYFPEIFDSLAPKDVVKNFPNSEKDFYPYKHGDKLFNSQKLVPFQDLKFWLDFQDFTSDIQVDLPEFKIPEGLPREGCIVAIQSPMGTGKTQSALDYIKINNDLKNEGIFWISARNKLLFQVIAEGSKKDLKIYHLNDDDGTELLMDTTTHQALCGESLHKIEDYFFDRDVWIDEICTVLEQILGGGTIRGGKQAKCLEIFKAMFQHARTVYLLDANLNDATVSFLSQLAPEKKVIKIKNIAKPRQANFKVIETFRVDEKTEEVIYTIKDKSVLAAKLKNPDIKPWIVTDSRKFADVLGMTMTQSQKWGFTLHQETSEETWQELSLKFEDKNTSYEPKNQGDLKWGHEFLKSPNDFINQQNPVFFIGSPTIENGVSYTGKDVFNSKFAFFHGTLSVNGAMQMLFRNRDNSITTEVFCPIKSTIPREKNPPNAPEIAKQQLNIEIEKIRQINASYRGEDYSTLYLKAVERINTVWWEYADILDRVKKFEQDNLRACLIWKLENAGHIVEIVEEESEQKTKEQLASNRKFIDEQEAIEIFNAEPFLDRQEAEKAKKKKPGKVTNRRSTKTWIVEKLPGIEESEVWNSDFVLKYVVADKHLLEKFESRYNFFNPEIEERVREFYDFFKLSSEFITPKSILNRQTIILCGLRKLKVDKLIELLESGDSIHKDSEVVNEIFEACTESKSLQKLEFFKVKTAKKPKKRQSVEGQEKIELIKKFLDYLGYSLKSEQKRVNELGFRTRFYSLTYKDNEKFEQSEILKSIAKRNIDFLNGCDYKKPDWAELKSNDGRLPDSWKVNKAIENANITIAKHNHHEDKEENEIKYPITFKGREENLTIESTQEFKGVLINARKILNYEDVEDIESARKASILLFAYTENIASCNIIDTFDSTFNQVAYEPIAGW